MPPFCCFHKIAGAARIIFIASSDYASIMVDDTSISCLKSRIAQVKINLRSWSIFEWVFLWGVIPALLFMVYALPQSIKNYFFIVDTANPLGIQTYILFAYTHSELYWHLIGNVAFYFVILFVIFAFENNKRRFRIMAMSSFLLVPIITAILTIIFFRILGLTRTSQGFSAIDGAFLAYAIFITVIWIVQNAFEEFDHPELFADKKIIYYSCQVLLIIMLGLFVFEGITFGQFLNSGGQITNGIAHFGGFITGLITLLLFDIRTAKRKKFDMILSLVSVIGIIWYVNYLINISNFKWWLIKNWFHLLTHWQFFHWFNRSLTCLLRVNGLSLPAFFFMYCIVPFKSELCSRLTLTPPICHPPYPRFVSKGGECHPLALLYPLP